MSRKSPIRIITITPTHHSSARATTLATYPSTASKHIDLVTPTPASSPRANYSKRFRRPTCTTTTSRSLSSAKPKSKSWRTVSKAWRWTRKIWSSDWPISWATTPSSPNRSVMSCNFCITNEQSCAGLRTKRNNFVIFILILLPMITINIGNLKHKEYQVFVNY